jgi:aspartate ammonia-lyase
MATKKKIVAPAIKEKKTGIIMEAPSKAWAHDQIEAAEHVPDKKVKRGFVTSEDKFVGRKKAAKIAKKAGQIKKDVKKLHSTDLRKAGGIMKKKLK